MCNSIKEEIKDYEILRGIIDSSGSGGSTWGDKEKYTFSFNLVVWYGEDRKVINERLYISQEVEHSKLRELMNRASGETTIKIKVKKGADTERAELIEILDVNFGDELLREHLEEIKREISYTHDKIGKLTLDKSLREFEKGINWCGKKAELRLNTDSIDKLQEIIPRVVRVIEEEEAWDKRARVFAAEKLLELKNEYWVDEEEGEEQITKEAFAKCLTLESLVIQESGKFTFWYDDGDIFYGHVIIVEVDSDGRFIDAEMAG